MFDNCGTTLKKLAVVTTALGILGAWIGAIVMMVSGSVLVGFIVGVSGTFGAWVSGLVLYAIGEAAESAVKTLYYCYNAPSRKKEENAKKVEDTSGVAAAWNPNGKIPAWQRVEMEKEEAARKAAEEARQ